MEIFIVGGSTCYFLFFHVCLLTQTQPYRAGDTPAYTCSWTATKRASKRKKKDFFIILTSLWGSSPNRAILPWWFVKDLSCLRSLIHGGAASGLLKTGLVTRMENLKESGKMNYSHKNWERPGKSYPIWPRDAWWHWMSPQDSMWRWKLFHFKDEAYFILVLFSAAQPEVGNPASTLIKPKGFAPSTHFCSGQDPPKAVWRSPGLPKHKTLLPQQRLYLFLAVM